MRTGQTVPGKRNKAGPPGISFISHGAPIMVLDRARGEEFGLWARDLWPEAPDLVLCISAHWQTRNPTLGTDRSQDLIYDFYGFPQELYSIQYPAPGEPQERQSLLSFLQGRGYAAGVEDRGLDHGVWTPLFWLFPAANVPVLQLSLPEGSPGDLFELGKTLFDWAVSDSRRVWILGSGGMTHNLSAIDFGLQLERQEFREFEGFIREVIQTGDWEALMEYRSRAPHAALNHPTDEHFLPLLVVAGAACRAGDRNVVFPLEGFEFGSLSRTCVDFR